MFFLTIWLCIPHVDFAAAFLAHIADFSCRTLFGHNYTHGGRIRPKLSGQLFAFYTGTIYDTFILQLCTQRFGTTVLGVYFCCHFLAFIVIAYANRYRYIRTTFTFYRYLIFTAYAHKVFKNLGAIFLHVHKLSRLVQYFASPWYFVISSSSLSVFYLQIQKFRFCIRLLVSDSPGKFMHISTFLY